MAQAHVPSIDGIICREVTRLVSCTVDELAQRVPAYSWSQVFTAIDRLSREGTLTVSRTGCFGYVVSIGPVFARWKIPGPVRTVTRFNAMRDGNGNDSLC